MEDQNGNLNIREESSANRKRTMEKEKESDGKSKRVGPLPFATGAANAHTCYSL